MATAEGRPHRGRGPFGPAFGPLLAAAQDGAGWAFRQLYEAFAPSVSAYATTQGSVDPEGLANETFLRLFNGITRFAGDEERFRSWLFTIAHNLLVDERRRRSRRVVEHTLEEGDWVHPSRTFAAGADDLALDRLADGRVLSLLSELSADQRDVLLLRIVADLTAEQTAASLGKTVGAVKQLQRRGLDSLRRIITTKGVSL